MRKKKIEKVVKGLRHPPPHRNQKQFILFVNSMMSGFDAVHSLAFIAKTAAETTHGSYQ